MDTQPRSSIQHVIEDALRRLVADPATRDKAVYAVEQAAGHEQYPEWQKMRALAWINRDELLPSVRRLEEEGFRFGQMATDSPEAHRKAADVQRILHALGFNLGPDGVDGYIGGPPGEPVTLDVNECTALIERGTPREKLLGTRPQDTTESWTRDATRRLQTFLGRSGLPTDRPELRRNCLVRPDGLFGSLTLAGVRAFLQAQEPQAPPAQP